MTKKIIRTGNFKSSLLADELQEAIGWNPVTAEGTSRLKSKSDGSEVTIFADDDTPILSIDVVVNEHDPNALSVGEQNQANRDDAQARFLLSQLANKTPQQIYTVMQTKMDNWTSLADAKSDLREWLPLLAAIIAWKVV